MSKNPEDEGRFLKSLLWDVPTDYGLTRNESILRTLTTGLRDMRERLPATSLVAPTPTSMSTPPPTTHVEVNVPDPARSLGPYFDDLSRVQREAVTGIRQLANQGEKGLTLQAQQQEELVAHTRQGEIASSQRQDLIGQARLTVMYLESLDTTGRNAYLQRHHIMTGLFETRRAISELDKHTVEGMSTLHTDLIGLQGLGQAELDELRQHTKLIDEIAQLEGLHLEEARGQTRQLAHIEVGVRAIPKAIQSAADQVGEKIDAASIILSRAESQLQHIAGSSDMMVLTSMHMRRSLEGILAILQTPVQIRAQDYWNIGEKCRKVGDPVEAIRMLQKSLDENPSDPYPYYSLGMLCLEIGAVQASEDFFAVGLKYARENPQEAAYFLLQIGKLAIIRRDYEKAKKLLEEAHGLDRTNIDIWYELALVEVKLGNNEKAVYYLQNLLHVARRKNSGYVNKVMHEPEFAPILSQLV